VSAPLTKRVNSGAVATGARVGTCLREKARTWRWPPIWPTSTSDYAWPMNEIPKVVFSRTLERADWPETRIARGDLSEEIGRLKREPGNDLIAYGGATLDQAPSRLGLVDEYRLMVQPAALGAGLLCLRICPRRCTSSSSKQPPTRRASPSTSTGRAQVAPSSRSIRTNPNGSASATSDRSKQEKRPGTTGRNQRSAAARVPQQRKRCGAAAYERVGLGARPQLLMSCESCGLSGSRDLFLLAEPGR
jgi:dihydrofolate reductase